MKTPYRFYFLALLVVFASTQAYAQVPFYGQIFANRLQLNPALAGSQGTGYVMAQYRAQWVNIAGHRQQGGIAFDQALSKGWGLGINSQYDLSLTGFIVSNHHLHIAKEFQLGEKHFLRAGVSGGLNLRTINYNKLRFPDQIDPQTGMFIPSPTSGFEHFPIADFNAGLLYYNRLFFLSASARHLQGRAFVEVGESYPGTLYAATTGVRIPIGFFSLSPLAHYQRRSDVDNMYMLGLALEMQKFQFITWYQPEIRFALGLGTTLGPVQLSYQYDHYLSDVNFAFFGPTHELSLGFRLGGKEKRERSSLPMPLN
ncbi:MAG: PorP/SprF family type IX secretion system membrane protein [Bacteroidota bacterium]